MNPTQDTIERPPAPAVPQTEPTPTPPRPIERLRRRQFRGEAPREIRHFLSIATARVLSRLVWLMPVGFRLWLADLGGKLFFRFFKSYRRHVYGNVRQVLGPDASQAAVDEIVQAIYRRGARNFADLLISRHVTAATIRTDVRVTEGSWGLLDEALAKGRGVIIVTGHLGSFDYIGHAVGVRGYPIISVTGRTTNRFVFDAVTYLRASHSMRIAEATPSGIRRVIRALRKGECVAFLADYDYFQNGRPVTLFGRKTTLPPGPIRLARDTGALVLPLFAHVSPKGHEVLISPAFQVEKTADLEADMTRGLQQIAEILEPRIRASLDQWVMFQAMWPEEDASLDPAALAADGHGDEPVPPGAE